MTKRRNVHLLEGEKHGPARRTSRDQYVIHHMEADAVFEMDADCPHDPADVPRMMGGLESMQTL